jgi:hypothetical protein
VDALPYYGLIEAAEDMLCMINTTEGLMILNTDRIAMIGKRDDNNFKIITDCITSTEVNAAAEFQITRYQYREFVVSAEELADLLSKLPEAKYFPKE